MYSKKVTIEVKISDDIKDPTFRKIAVADALRRVAGQLRSDMFGVAFYDSCNIAGERTVSKITVTTD